MFQYSSFPSVGHDVFVHAIHAESKAGIFLLLGGYVFLSMPCMLKKIIWHLQLLTTREIIGIF